MEDFFAGLEHSSAFQFVQNEEGKFVSIKQTDYRLFEGDISPFVEFGEELRTLNDYCFLVAQVVERELTDKQEALEHSCFCPEQELDWLVPFTRTELVLRTELEQQQWKWAVRIWC